MTVLVAPSIDSGHVQSTGWIIPNGTAALATDQANTGTYSLKCPASGSNYFDINSLTPIADGRDYWFHFYFRVASGAIGANKGICYIWSSSGSELLWVHLTPAGLLRVKDYAGAVYDVSSGITPTRDAWHHISLRVTYNVVGNDTFELWYDGAQVITPQSFAMTAGTMGDLWFGDFEGQACDLWMSDLVINDNQGSGVNGRLDQPKVYTLRPTGDGTAGTSEANWVLASSGGTGSRFAAEDNQPPVFNALASLTDAQALKNVTNAIADRTAALQTYAAAGIKPWDRVEAVIPWALTGSSSATDTTGTLTMVSNPSDAGSAMTTFDNGIASATASTWPRKEGIITERPNISVSTAPNLRLRRAASALTVMENGMGLVVVVTRGTPDVIIPPILT